MKGSPPFDGLEEVPAPQMSKRAKVRIQRGPEFTLVNQHENPVRPPCPEVWKHESFEEVQVERVGRKERYSGIQAPEGKSRGFITVPFP